MKLARGHWQEEILRDLLKGEKVANPVGLLRGNARSYAGRYAESLRNLFTRMEAAGYRVEMVEYGPRGGYLSGYYRITGWPDETR